MQVRHDSSADSLAGATRGVSPVIAVVLLLAVALLALTILQTTAIPLLNSQAEFEHSQRVQGDMVGLDAAAGRAAVSGYGESATVELGLRYPQRLLFINPPPASGSLETTEDEAIRIENARVTGETGDYWDGSTKTIETQTLVYRPDYNEYDRGPTTVVEPWAVYNRIDDQTLPRTETDLIDGRRLSLVALDGRYSRSTSDTRSVDIAPTSAPVQTVTVSNGAAPIELTLPTGLRNDTWAELLDGELDQPGTADDRYVTGFRCQREPPDPCGALTVTLEPGSYELALGEVSVGSGETDEPAAYLTDVEGELSSVSEGSRQRLVVEARDQYDNPVSGVDVESTVVDGPGFVRPVSPTTDERGRAVFLYEAPDDVSATESVRVRSAFGDGSQQRAVEFDVQVVGRQGSADPQPTSGDAISPVTGTVDSANINGNNRGREVTFDITAERSVTIEQINVFTQNEMESRPYTEMDTTVAGSNLSSAFEGQTTVALRDFDSSNSLPVDRFVEPSDPDADILVTIEFADGSSRTLGIA